MTLEQALQNIEAALAQIQASLAVHQGLQKSLQVVKEALEPKAKQ